MKETVISSNNKPIFHVNSYSLLIYDRNFTKFPFLYPKPHKEDIYTHKNANNAVFTAY